MFSKKPLVFLLLACALMLAGCVQGTGGGQKVGYANSLEQQAQATDAPSGADYAYGQPTGGQPIISPEATDSPSQAGPQVFEFTVDDTAFDPISRSVPLGASVKFTNTGRGAHDVVFIDRESKLLTPGDSYQTAFDKPGSYGFSDSFNTDASGTVEVS